MKSVKLFVTLVTVLLFCTALTACAGENREQPKQDAVQVEVEQKERAQLPEDGVDGGQAEREREAREADERAEQERQRQEEEARQREEEEHQQQQQTGNYEHKIGDAVFYTYHDLWNYLLPDPKYPGYSILDIEAMLADVWGTSGGTQVGNGYAFSDGSSFTSAVSYDYADGVDDAYAHNASSSYYFVVSITGEQQYRTCVTAYNEPMPSGGWAIVKGDRRGFGFSPDMAALLLYVLEQTQLNPRSNIGSELALPSNYECGLH